MAEDKTRRTLLRSVGALTAVGATGGAAAKREGSGGASGDDGEKGRGPPERDEADHHCCCEVEVPEGDRNPDGFPVLPRERPTSEGEVSAQLVPDRCFKLSDSGQNSGSSSHGRLTVNGNMSGSICGWVTLDTEVDTELRATWTGTPSQIRTSTEFIMDAYTGTVSAPAGFEATIRQRSVTISNEWSKPPSSKQVSMNINGFSGRTRTGVHQVRVIHSVNLRYPDHSETVRVALSG